MPQQKKSSSKKSQKASARVQDLSPKKSRSGDVNGGTITRVPGKYKAGNITM